jgi:hypothetical protein
LHQLGLRLDLTVRLLSGIFESLPGNQGATRGTGHAGVSTEEARKDGLRWANH